MIGCKADADGFFETVPRFAWPNACIKLLVSPFGFGRLTCIAMETCRLPSLRSPGRPVAVTIASCNSSALSILTNLRA